MNNHEAAALMASRAIQLKEQRNFKSAFYLAQRAANLIPDHMTPRGVMGAILWNLSRFEEGAKILEGCVRDVPDNHEYWAHLALCYSAMREDAKAEEAYGRSLALKPDDPAIIWNRSQHRLSMGDWARGLIDYDARITYRGKTVYPKLPFEPWEGQDLNGKTLLIAGEQGVGDTILSSRYFPLIKQRYPNCKIKWHVQNRVHDLFWAYRDCIDEFIPNGVPWPKMGADYSVHQMSLLRIFGTTPETIPPDPGLLRKRAMMQIDTVRVPEPHVPSLRIGLAWTGNTEMLANEVRSILLEDLLQLAEDPRYTFYSLQVGDGAKHIHVGGANDLVRDCEDDLLKAGFVGTAALMLNLDLILTVCTSTAHLAGALGVPCFVMLAHDCYWIWGREGNSTPWYPTSRLFRQPKTDDWASVIEDVRVALDQFWAERQPVVVEEAA